MALLLIDNNLLINEHLVLRINYNTNINKIPIDNIIESLNITLLRAHEESDKKTTYILLLDFKRVKKKYINIHKIKKILIYLQNKFPNKLEKCIVYNYSSIWKLFLTLITSLLDPVTKKKIILKTNVSKLLNSSVIGPCSSVQI